MSLISDFDKVIDFEIEQILKLIDEIDKSFNLLPHNEGVQN